jgi:hypothetical protein
MPLNCCAVKNRKLDLDIHDVIKRALASTLPGLEEELEKVRAQH